MPVIHTKRPAQRHGIRGFEIVREWAPGDTEVLTFVVDSGKADAFCEKRNAHEPTRQRPYIDPAGRQAYAANSRVAADQRRKQRADERAERRKG